MVAVEKVAEVEVVELVVVRLRLDMVVVENVTEVKVVRLAVVRLRVEVVAELPLEVECVGLENVTLVSIVREVVVTRVVVNTSVPVYVMLGVLVEVCELCIELVCDDVVVIESEEAAVRVFDAVTSVTIVSETYVVDVDVTLYQKTSCEPPSDQVT